MACLALGEDSKLHSSSAPFSLTCAVWRMSGSSSLSIVGILWIFPQEVTMNLSSAHMDRNGLCPLLIFITFVSLGNLY